MFNHDLYSKEEVISVIGERRWSDFEDYMLGQTVQIDEAGLDMYFPTDVGRYCSLHNIR